MPHRRGLGELATDQRAETSLGRLVLLGSIEPALGLAGETYNSLWRGYLISIAAPHQLANGHSYGSCDGCPNPAQRKHCRCDFRCRIFVEARGVLFRAGSEAAMQVYRVATDDQRCSNLAALRVGLSALARHFGLTPREKGLLPKSSIECVAPAPS